MSLEAWGSGDEFDADMTDERCEEIACAAFVKGIQMAREISARTIERRGDIPSAGAIRANWNPAWGSDPGRISDEDYDKISACFDCWHYAP